MRQLRNLFGLRLPGARAIQFGGHDAADRREDRPLRNSREELRARDLASTTAAASTGVIYFDAQKREVRQKAKAVILSANGSESARLLLLSKSAVSPMGWRTRAAWSARYLMFGNGASASALFEHPLNEYKGVISGAGIVDYVPSDPKRGFYGGGRMTARGYLTPLELGLDGLSPEAPRWGAGYKKALREEANHRMTITCFVTQLPLETNRVDLDPDVKDDWGLPAMRITSSAHPDDIKNMEFFRQEIHRSSGGRRSEESLGASSQRKPRRRAQPRHLPHGERSEDIGGRQVPQGSRCAEPVHRGRQQLSSPVAAITPP